MTSDGEALTGLSFVDEPSALQVTQSLPVFAAACRWLDLYFSGKVPDFTPQLSLQGSDFRRAVWVSPTSIGGGGEYHNRRERISPASLKGQEEALSIDKAGTMAFQHINYIHTKIPRKTGG